MKIKRRHVKMARAAWRQLPYYSDQFNPIARWHAAARGK